MNIHLPKSPRLLFLGAVAAAATAAAPATHNPALERGPELVVTAIEGDEDSCRFAIKAYNDRSRDVVVMLYDSRVQWSIYMRQLKIQNYRVAPGKSLDARYEAPGRCSIQRTWTFYTRLGGWNGTKGWVQYRSDGDSTDGRNINLGRTSRWSFPG